MTLTAASDTIQAMVRPVVTFIFAAAIVVGFLTGKLSGETFMGTAGVIMAFWFGQRSPAAPERPSVIEASTQRGNVTVEGAVKG